MKKTLHIIILTTAITLLMGSVKTKAQNHNNGLQLLAISVKNIESNNYINFSLSNKSDKNIIVLERQKSDKTFEWINTWVSIPSPGNEKLLYSYIDEKQKSDDITYRVSIIEAEGLTLLGYSNSSDNTEMKQIQVNLLATGK